MIAVQRHAPNNSFFDRRRRSTTLPWVSPALDESVSRRLPAGLAVQYM
ncbi:hypothetical protein [Azospirillum largimobile]